MKFLIFVLITILLASTPTHGMEARTIGYFRGVFEHNSETFAVTLSHDEPNDLRKNERIKYHMTLENGCQIYAGTTLYTPGKILISAESIYITEGSEKVGLGHFDLFQLQCDIDPQGIITKMRLILPDGTVYQMDHDPSAAISQLATPIEHNTPSNP